MDPYYPASSIISTDQDSELSSTDSTEPNPYKFAGFYLTKEQLIKVSHTIIKEKVDAEELESLDLETREKEQPYASAHILTLCHNGRAPGAISLAPVKGTFTDASCRFADILLIVHIEFMDENGEMTPIPFISDPDSAEMKTIEWLNHYGLDKNELEKKYMTLPYSTIPSIRNFPLIFTKYFDRSI